MAASIILDQAVNVAYTNLDQLSGKVVLRCPKQIEVDSILVKVEGESRTRLLSPPGPNGERPKPQLEYHKILYKVQMVYPRNEPVESIQGKTPSTPKAAHTIGPGTHEYSFSVKLPFNNACASDRSQMASMSISASGVEIAMPPQGHVKKTLPPTLSGFPGEAEIRYFVKATVRRSSFWKENPRAYSPFNFFPIEPPRPIPTGNEVFARQRHDFNAIPGSDNGKSRMKSLFGISKEKEAGDGSSDAPRISIDARLPEPAILTCNEDIPLRLIVKKLNLCNATIYLQSLQVSLIANTKIRAHDVYRTESNSWVIMSRSNMGLPIGVPSDPVGKENAITDSLWRGQILPNTVAPSFETCNISRSYQLDVRVGLSYSGSHASPKPQTIILPLRIDAKVFSGIAPPPQLLEAMAQARPGVQRKPLADTSQAVDEKVKAESGKPSAANAGTQAEGPAHEAPAASATGAPTQPPVYDDAPPSYEDAVASSIPSVDARRPDYAPPPAGEDDVLRNDEKRGMMRRDS